LAASSLGEARYRIPFDALFILLAASFFRESSTPEHAHPQRLLSTRVAIVASAVLAGALSALMLAVSHPSIALAARLSGAPKELDCRVELSVAASEAEVRAPTSFPLRRRRTCSELRVTLGKLAHQRAVEVSGDPRDRYQLTFYRHGQPVGVTTWSTFADRAMRNVTLKAPPAAVSAGYDELGLSALYGDGGYGIGHVKLID
jgi:hypothetical protein